MAAQPVTAQVSPPNVSVSACRRISHPLSWPVVLLVLGTFIIPLSHQRHP
jgi:hypothetical protein